MFVPQEYPLPHPNMLRRVEQTFVQKPTRIPLEIQLTGTLPYLPQPRNDLALIIIGSITILGLVGLFLAYFLTKR